MNVGDKVYVVNWGKHYSQITRRNSETKEIENIFPIQTKLPPYCGISHHWKYVYEPNLTLKGTVNKREPKKLVEKIPVYKDYKWEVLEIFKHPETGKSGYTEENLLLLASTHTDKNHMKCYIIIEEGGVSLLTPEQYKDANFKAFIQANLKKYDKTNFKDAPDEIISVYYDKDDNVLFGSCMVKGLVSYRYLESRFTKDEKPLYIGWEITYGKSLEDVPEEDKHKIKPFAEVKKLLS